jgi:hypothetical protein
VHTAGISSSKTLLRAGHPGAGWKHLASDARVNAHQSNGFARALSRDESEGMESLSMFGAVRRRLTLVRETLFAGGQDFVMWGKPLPWCVWTFPCYIAIPCLKVWLMRVEAPLRSTKSLDKQTRWIRYCQCAFEVPVLNGVRLEWCPSPGFCHWSEDRRRY